MKVAFWSNVSGKCSTTANTAALSVMSALECGNKVIVFENHSGICGLDSALISSGKIPSKVYDNSFTYNTIGMNSLLRKMHYSGCENESIINNVIGFCDNRLLYIPGYNSINEDVFEYELNMVIERLLINLERFGQNVFVDTANNNNLSTKIILNEADIVVVNLNQNHKVIQDFFDNYSSILHKTFFVLGNYEPYSRFDIQAISKHYKIKPDCISAIPYNYEFREALLTGTVVDFILRNYNCSRRDDNYYFINQLKKTAIMLNNKMIVGCEAG